MSEPMTPERIAGLRASVTKTPYDPYSATVAELLDEIDRLRASQAALTHAIQRVIEATGIKLTNPSVDLADELSNVMQAFICNRSNDVLALTQERDRLRASQAEEKERAEINWTALGRIKEKWATERARVKKLEEALRPAAELIDAMETCHDCKGQILIDEGPIYCEDCSPDCEDHDGPRCADIADLHRLAKLALKAVDRHASPNQDDVAEQSMGGGTK